MHFQPFHAPQDANSTGWTEQRTGYAGEYRGTRTGTTRLGPRDLLGAGRRSVRCTGLGELDYIPTPDEAWEGYLFLLFM